MAGRQAEITLIERLLSFGIELPGLIVPEKLSVDGTPNVYVAKQDIRAVLFDPAYVSDWTTINDCPLALIFGGIKLGKDLVGSLLDVAEPLHSMFLHTVSYDSLNKYIQPHPLDRGMELHSGFGRPMGR